MAERVTWAVSPSVMTTVDTRHSMGSLWTPGSGAMIKRVGRIPNAVEPFKVLATSPTPDGLVHVNPGYLVAMGTRSIAPYIQALDAIKDINILSTPAHGTLTRWDLIIAQQNDVLHADADNTWTVKQVVGTPSATPSDPTVTGSPDYVVLARVVVGPTVTSIIQANITQLLTAYTVPVGGILRVPTQAVRDAIAAPFESMSIYREDRDWLEVYDGAAWRVHDLAICSGSADLTSAVTNPYEGQLAYRSDIDAYFRYTGSAWRALQGIGGRWRQDTTGQTITAPVADTKVTFNTAIDTPVGISYSAGEFTILEPGKWDLNACLAYPFTASLETWGWLGPSSGTTTRWDLDADVAPAGSGPPIIRRSRIVRTFALNDKFSFWTWHNSGTNKTLDVSYGGITHLEATYLGPA